jgi:hypothetical protein
VMIGGEGMPNPTALDIVGEFLGFRPMGTDPSSPNLSNHMFELEALVRIPQLRGVELYGNMAIEDKWKSVKKTLIQGCSYLGGVYVPALTASGATDLRIEYVHMNPLQYRHGIYGDGYTLNRRLIGSDAGPDANTLHAVLRQRISKDLWYAFTFDWDQRGSNSYTELQNPDGTAGDIVMTAAGPYEQRFRGLADVDWRMRRDLTLHVTGGVERALNLQYQEGVDRTNYMIAASLKIDFDRFFAFAR